MAGDNDSTPKKDLTSIVDLAKRAAESGDLPRPEDGFAAMEEVPLEKVDAFESLEEYVQSHPMPDPPQEDFTSDGADEAIELPGVPDAPVELPHAGDPNFPDLDPAADASAQADFSGMGGIPGLDPGGDTNGISSDAEGSTLGGFADDGDFPVSENAQGDSDFLLSESAQGDNDFSATGPSGADFAMPEGDPANTDFPVAEDADFSIGDPSPDDGDPSASAGAPNGLGLSDDVDTGPGDALSMASDEPSLTVPPPSESIPAPSSGPDGDASVRGETISSGLQASQEEDSEPRFTTPPPPPAPERPGSSTLDRIREMSDRMPMGRPAVPAALPFSLMIEGPLSDIEKEKLSDLVTRHQMGFTEEELQPQLEAGKILIPRISEYAGILIVQALRDTRAVMKFGPSDTIFSTESTREDDLVSPPPAPGENEALVYAESASHPAEDLPLTSAHALPGLPDFKIIDALSASASIKASIVEAQSSSEYQEALEALQREIRYKAYRKGASSILGFHVTLASLSDSPTHYRLMVKGTAVRPFRPGEKRPWEDVPAAPSGAMFTSGADLDDDFHEELAARHEQNFEAAEDTDEETAVAIEAETAQDIEIEAAEAIGLAPPVFPDEADDGLDELPSISLTPLSQSMPEFVQEAQPVDEAARSWNAGSEMEEPAAHETALAFAEMPPLPPPDPALKEELGHAASAEDSDKDAEPPMALGADEADHEDEMIDVPDATGIEGVEIDGDFDDLPELQVSPPEFKPEKD